MCEKYLRFINCKKKDTESIEIVSDTEIYQQQKINPRKNKQSAGGKTAMTQY